MKTYYLTLRWKLIYCLWSIITIGLVFGTFAYFVRTFLVLYLIIALFVMLSVIYGIATERIIISEKGIEYRTLAFAFDANWSDMDEVGYSWFREGLFIEKEAIKTKYVNRNAYATFMGFGQSAFIPLSSFSNNWRTSELGQQIKQYAPRLFQ